MATTVISSMIYVPWLQLTAKISDSGHMLPEGPGIAFKYTDLPVFLLNSEYKYWQIFKNTEKIRFCTYNILYGAYCKITGKACKVLKNGKFYTEK